MAGLRELYSTVRPLLAIAPIVGADDDVTGVIIDTRGADAHLFIGVFGSIGASDGAVLTIEEGDDPALADASTAGSADVIVEHNTNQAGGPNSVEVGEGETVARIAYVGNKRYIRLVAAVTGEVDIAATYIGSNLHDVPVRALP